MIVLNGNIYVERSNTYVKCTLKQDASGISYLEETDVVIRRLKGKFEVLTWPELLARYPTMGGETKEE